MKLDIPSNKKVSCRINNVLYVPGLTHNLLSVSQLTANGKDIVFFENSCKILHGSKIVAYGHKIGNLYVLSDGNVQANLSKSNELTANLWHRRFCHLGMKNLQKICDFDMVKGLDSNLKFDKVACENCCEGKIHRLPFPKNEKNDKYGLLDLISSDVCGPLNQNH